MVVSSEHSKYREFGESGEYGLRMDMVSVVSVAAGGACGISILDLDVEQEQRVQTAGVVGDELVIEGVGPPGKG